MIKSIQLKNFRNHEDIVIEFPTQMTFIEGSNGIGKTSILEAIYFISLLKSFRTNDDSNLITNNKPYTKITLQTNHHLYEAVLTDKTKHLKIDGVVIPRMSQFIGGFKTIIFSPEDLNIITGTPGIRRSFLDIEMVQLEDSYIENLSIYKKVLRERNALLKMLKPNDDLTFLKIIDKRLENEASKIILKRQTFIEKLNNAFKSRFKSFNDKDRVELTYEPNTTAEALERRLKERFTNDLLMQSTSVGPHRDEFLIKFNGELAKNYASQGQIRLIAISLKLALIDLLDPNENVVILLDDILSELDEQKIKQIETIFKLQKQIILTGVKSNYTNINIINLDEKRKIWWQIMIIVLKIFKY